MTLPSHNQSKTIDKNTLATTSSPSLPSHLISFSLKCWLEQQGLFQRARVCHVFALNFHVHSEKNAHSFGLYLLSLFFFLFFFFHTLHTTITSVLGHVRKILNKKRAREKKFHNFPFSGRWFLSNYIHNAKNSDEELLTICAMKKNLIFHLFATHPTAIAYFRYNAFFFLHHHRRHFITQSV